MRCSHVSTFVYCWGNTLNINAIILILIFLVIYIAISIKRKQKDAAIVFIVIAFLAILLGGNTSNPDYDTYHYTYLYGRENSIEIFYTFFISLGKRLGFSFEVFRFEIYCLALLLLYIAITRFSKMTLPFWVLYFIFPMILDGTQTRNFLAMVIVINAIVYLFDRNKTNIVKFCALIVIAAGFQALSLLYLLLLLIPYLEESKYLKRTIIAVLIISVLIALNKTVLSSMIQFLISLIGDIDPRIEKYGVVRTRYGFLFSWLIHVIIWGFSAYLRKKVLVEDKEDENKVKLIEFGYWLSIVSILYFPFYVLVSTFDRIYRTIIIVEYAIWTFVIQKKPVKRVTTKVSVRVDTVLIFITVISFSLLLFFGNIDSLYHETMVVPFFEDNWIIQKLVNTY